MIKNVFIRTRPGADTAISDSLLIAVSDCIRNNGKEVLNHPNNVTKETLVLALGGDGTMLSAIHLAAEHGAYVTGFNYGHLGYLVPNVVSSVRGLTAQLCQLLEDIDIINIDDQMFKTTTYKLPTLKWKRQTAINDFYFVPELNGSAADFTIAVGSEDSYFETKSSGVVLSTPFGSTGLALSAGGAILSPNSGVLEVVPMLPHTLTSRPIIFPDTDKVTVSWERRVSMFADGRHVDNFPEDKVTIKCVKRKINLVQPAQWDFFENLKNKMRWHS